MCPADGSGGSGAVDDAAPAAPSPAPTRRPRLVVGLRRRVGGLARGGGGSGDYALRLCWSLRGLLLTILDQPLQRRLQVLAVCSHSSIHARLLETHGAKLGLDARCVTVRRRRLLRLGVVHQEC